LTAEVEPPFITVYSKHTFCAMATPASISFAVRRCEPELVAPAKATPHEFRQLSDIDRQLYLQFQSPHYNLYAYNPLMQGKDPVKVIKEAIAQALVYYYPFAGRIRQGPDNKLIVDCTGEGVLFIEADADATVEQFGDPIPSPFPCFQELLYNVPGSERILNTPLLLFQVRIGHYWLMFIHSFIIIIEKMIAPYAYSKI